MDEKSKEEEVAAILVGVDGVVGGWADGTAAAIGEAWEIGVGTKAGGERGTTLAGEEAVALCCCGE